MIRIQKGATPPAHLTTSGAARTERDCQAFDTGAREFAFSESIYKHATVRAALEAAQHDKCCYCERFVGADGDVEHFRPKSKVKQALGMPDEVPGYYWLAYNWENLFLSCGPCNSRRKRLLFPLRDATRRARSHHDALTAEDPLLVKPDEEDPAEHIGFRAEVPFARTDRGEATLRALGLDRDVLCEARLERIQVLMQLYEIDRLADERAGDTEFQRVAGDARSQIASFLSDAGEFAACARSAFGDAFRLVPSPA